MVVIINVVTVLYQKLEVFYAKNIMPFACIGSDVIVGFPGEKFYRNLLSEINISYLHVFSYSERRNTKAFIMNNS